MPTDSHAKDELIVQGIAASQGVFDPNTGLWNLASLPTGSTATLSYTIAAPSMAGTLTDTTSTLANKARAIRKTDSK